MKIIVGIRRLLRLNSLAHALSPYDLMIIGNEKRVGREGEDFPLKFLGGNTLTHKGFVAFNSAAYPSISLADN